MNPPSDLPLSGVLRTPDDRFDALTGYSFAPHYVSSLPGFTGIRVHYLDEGPKAADTTVLCLHGQPTWSYLYRKMLSVFVAAGQRRVNAIHKPMEVPMKGLRALVLILLVFSSARLAAADGLVALKSPRSAKETMNRLEEIVKQRGLNVFARIDHAAGAAKVGKALRPTEVLMFGNPQGGTPLMECAQSAGIDLPLKALVWEDASAQVWLGYNDPGYLAQRHGAAQCPVVENLRKALAGIAEGAVAP